MTGPNHPDRADLRLLTYFGRFAFVVGFVSTIYVTVSWVESRDVLSDSVAPTVAEVSDVMGYKCPGVVGVEATRQCSLEAIAEVRNAKRESFDSVVAKRQLDINVGAWALAAASLLLTVGALTFVFSTLVATRKAVAAAVDANEGFRLSAERQLRPYMTIDGITDSRWHPSTYQAQAVWKNTGQSPARNVRGGYGSWSAATTPPSTFDFPDDAGASAVAPMGGVGAGATIFVDGPSVTSAERNEIAAGQRHVIFWSWVEYGDGFNETPTRRSEYCAKLLVINTGQGVSQVSWQPYGPFNGMDETSFLFAQSKPSAKPRG